jgi:hypothetical protein
LDTLVPHVQIITRPKRWWLPGAAWVASVVLVLTARFA